MTEERQAVETLAKNLVKAMRSVSANTPSRVGNGSTNPSTIQASKIVGLPAAFSSIITGIESSAAGGDAIAQQTLNALNHIAAGEFETITADTANIEKLYATFGDFITLVAEDAQIGDLDVETIRAGLAEVGLINIGSANIDMAQIVRSSTQTAFIHESIQGKVYIDDLAVNDASIVNLSAGTVLINNPNGELVELYVDNQGNVNTRAVAYDGSDIINQDSLSGNTIINNTLSGDAVITNSLNGSKIVSNSITTSKLNANEIFAAQGTIMNLIADNIEATRLFANQGFINALQTTIISSDLSSNTSIIELTDSINLMAANTSRTFIQKSMPVPVHTSDTWFDPSTEEHYVANDIFLPIPQMVFGHDENGNLRSESVEDYRLSINSDGELMLLVVNDEAATIIVQEDIDFEIVDDRVYSDKLWRKIDNVAFSRLKVSVDGIISEVYNSETGTSRIEQNADQIIAIVSGNTAVPYVETSSIKIKEDKVEIKSAGEVDIKASNFSISFNTDGILENKSRVDINNNDGIKVSDSYGNYFQATSTKIGLFDIQDNPKLYIDNTGHAFFNGSLTLGGANNVNGSMSVKDANGNTIVLADNSGLNVYNSAGTSQFYIDSTTGNATFAGSLNAATGTFAGSVSASSIVGGQLIIGGRDNVGSSIELKDANNNSMARINNQGIWFFSYGSSDNSGPFFGLFRLWTNYDGDYIASIKQPSLHNGSLYLSARGISNNILVSSTTKAVEFLEGNLCFAFGGVEYVNTSLEYISSRGYRFRVGVYDSETDFEPAIDIYNIDGYSEEYIYTYFDTQFGGDITVSGTKSRSVSTSQYSDRLLYCYETPSPLFGDVGEGVISSDGQCYIFLDPIFAQTISTDQYQVFLQPYGEGNCYISERHSSYFVVSGTPNLSFGWELKAKQSDFDQLRLERNDEKFTVPRQTYGEDAASHIRELYDERTQQDKQESEEK